MLNQAPSASQLQGNKALWADNPEKIKWGSERNGPLACVRTFCFGTFQCELFIGVTFIVHFVCSHYRGALECSKGAHVSCPCMWSQVCCWQNPKNTSLPVRTVPWADLCSAVPGRAWRMVGDAPPLLSFQPAKSLRHSLLFFSSLKYYFGSPSFCLLYSGDTHHSDNTICLWWNGSAHAVFRVRQPWNQIPAQWPTCARTVNSLMKTNISNQLLY